MTVNIEELMGDAPAPEVSTVWFNHGMKGFYLLNYFNSEAEYMEREWLQIVFHLRNFSDADTFGVLATL